MSPFLASKTRPAGTLVKSVAALALTVVAGMFVVRYRSSFLSTDRVSRGHVAAHGTRAIEARLTDGSPWAPFQRESVLSAEQSELASTRGRESATSSVAGRHTAGLQLLIMGRPRDALELLIVAARSSNDAKAWSDASAAFDETAIRHEAPELLAKALTAIDRALALNPTLPEALFNRAVVLEHLGLVDDARDAWRRYLEIDGTSDWAVEARARAAALAPSASFIELLDAAYDRVAGDPAVAMSLASGDPLAARGVGAKDVLGRWAEAVLRGDEKNAVRHLGVARQLGIAVARLNGERMLERSVATIDAADDQHRAVLAAAHRDLNSGLQALYSNRPVDAEAMLHRAARTLREAGSPMILAARYFAALAAFEQGRQRQAQDEIDHLLSVTSADHPAYRVQMMWQLAVCHAAKAEWGRAIVLLEESASSFEERREWRNAGAARRLLAYAYDRTGDAPTAWKHRIASLRGLGRQSDLQLVKAISSIADSAVLHRDWETAASFLNLQLETARRLDDQVQLADAYLIRSVVRDRLRDSGGTQADVEEAKTTAARVDDPFYRWYLRIAELRARAMLSATRPGEAVQMLTEAIDFQITRSDLLNLPPLLLQRARARRNAGDPQGAMADVEQGIAALEGHRLSLPEGELRWGAFHASEELFAEAVDLAVQARDNSRALQFAEKARARALLESYGRPPVVDYTQLPRGTLVVAYAALPSRLIVFTADTGGVDATSINYTREHLAADIEAFVGALRRDRPDVALAGKPIFERLIAPVLPKINGAPTIVFVPDAVTSTLPFSALRDETGRYLLETHTILVAPSVATFIAAAETRKPVVPKTALVISSAAAAADSGRLAFADDEAEQIAKSYPNPIRAEDDTADLKTLVANAPKAEVIHFSGHAVGDDTGLDPASISLRDGSGERRVGVAEIAKLRLRRTAVVVLAGCSTARGERRAAEGVVSVAHGFLIAGAPSVIATLWPIEDRAAARFFPRLHARLADGVPAAEALRAVQLEAIRHGDVPASLWAAVQNIGR